MSISVLIAEAQRAAKENNGYDGYASSANGRFAIAVVGVGSPRTGRSSAGRARIDCYLNGKRVKRAVLEAAMREANLNA